MNQTLGCLLLVLTSGLFTGPAIAQQTDDTTAVDLTPKFTQKRVTQYEIWGQRDVDSTVAFQSAAQQQPGTQAPPPSQTQIKHQGQVTWQVQQTHDDSTATCVLTYDWLVVTITMPDGQEKQVDTREPVDTDNPIAVGLSKIIGHRFIFEISAQGEIDSTSGMDIFDQPEQGPAALFTQEDIMEDVFDLALLKQAPTNLAEGGQWQATMTQRHDAGKFQQDYTYQLASVGQIAGIPVAIIQGQAEVTLEPDLSKYPPQANPQVDLNQASAQTQIIFDLSRHEAVGRAISEQFEITVVISSPDFSMTIHVKEKRQRYILRISEK